jgi:DNA-binding CsgD family transcriptional regulator
MLGCSEFENRIVLLYAEHKSMRKISKITGISYSALRSVKEKIKKFANENPCNNSELS